MTETTGIVCFLYPGFGLAPPEHTGSGGVKTNSHGREVPQSAKVWDKVMIRSSPLWGKE